MGDERSTAERGDQMIARAGKTIARCPLARPSPLCSSGRSRTARFNARERSRQGEMFLNVPL